MIFAGYRDRMEVFFRQNPGMGSRVAHHLHFPDYSVEELAEIGELMARRARYELTPDGERGAAARTSSGAFASRASPTRAASATRSTGRACARRGGCSNAAAGSRRDLVTIEAEDILAARSSTD